MRATISEVKETVRARGWVRLLVHKDGFTIRNHEEDAKMKKASVKVGQKYMAKVSGKPVRVVITGESRYGGWDALNPETNRTIRIKSAQRLRPVPTPKVVVAGTVEAAGPKPDAPGAAAPVATTPKAPKAVKTAPRAPKAPTSAKATEKRMSGLDAVAQVLKEAGEPLDAKTMTERAIAKGLWKTGGKTPAATIYAAIIREIAAKGKDARFKKTDRGRFAFAPQN